MRIRIKNSDTFVNLIGYQGSVENHPILTDFSDIYELTSDEPTSSSSWFDCTYLGDPRNLPDYYITREIAGKELVRLVSDMLLKDIKSGVRTFDDTMVIEEKLEKTMASLNSGQLLTAKYKINLAQGSIPTDLYLFIFTSIDNLCNIHYA